VIGSYISIVLWDLKPLPAEASAQGGEAKHSEHSDLPAATAAQAGIPLDKDAVTSFVISEGLEKYKKELLDRRQRDAEIKRKYGIRSLESMILESDGKISDYETRKMKGENIPEAAIQNEVRKKEDLGRKKQRLQEEIEAETHLYPTDPRILGAVRVVPGKPHADMVSDLPAQAGKEIEQIGMNFVMEYERSHGRSPEDVSFQDLGYDIRSCDLPASAGQAGEKANYRYIEVKARAKEGVVALTPNEWLMAQRLKDEYWLYVVVNAANNPELYLIQNPSAKLEPDKVVDIVRYVVKNWKEKAECTK